MSAYAAFETIVIALLVFVSLRVVWQRVLRPALQKPKTGCGSACGSRCASAKSSL